jgi:hypothetical protein
MNKNTNYTKLIQNIWPSKPAKPVKANTNQWIKDRQQYDTPQRKATSFYTSTEDIYHKEKLYNKQTFQIW